MRACWHNLPLIGSAEQREGAEHAARNVNPTPDGLALDLEGTYDETAGIRQLRRNFVLDAEGLTMTDEGTLASAQQVTWIFLLRHEPVWQNGRITAGNLEILCPEGLAFEAEEKPVTDPRMARNWPGSLWRVSLRSEKTDRFRMTFRFSAKDQEA